MPLRDLLPSRVHGARIMTFAYNVEGEAGTDLLSAVGMTQLAQTLLDEVLRLQKCDHIKASSAGVAPCGATLSFS